MSCGTAGDKKSARTKPGAFELLIRYKLAVSIQHYDDVAVQIAIKLGWYKAKNVILHQ